MKKAIAVILSVVLVSLIVVAPVLADSSVQPRYIPCPGGGKHQMYTKGLANLYSGNSVSNPGSIIFTGTLSQCSQCRLYMVSECYPGAIISWLGRYATTSTVSTLNGASVVFGGIDGNNSSITSDPFIQGFEFH